MMDTQEKAATQLIQSAQDEIWDAGTIPEQLKSKVAEVMPGSEVMWLGFKSEAEQLMNMAAGSKLAPKASDKDYESALAMLTARLAVRTLQNLGPSRSASVREIAVAQHVIPNREALDRILRYESSIERSLNRALERLERMQRDRRNNGRTPTEE